MVWVCVKKCPKDNAWTAGRLPASLLIALIFSWVNLAVSQSALPRHDVPLQRQPAGLKSELEWCD